MRNNSPKITCETSVINLDEYKSVGTHWISLYVNGDNVKYFDSNITCFGVECFPKEITKLIGNKNITNIYRIQVNDSIMCRYFCIGFINFMLKGKSFVRLYQFIFSNQIILENISVLYYLW